MDESAAPDDPDVTALAAVAREYGHHAGRRFFAGVALDTGRRALTVYRVPNPDFDGEILRLLEGDVAVSLADAPHTREELLVAREQVWGLSGSLPITSVSVPVDGTRLLVVAEAPESDVQAALDRVVPGMAVASTGRAALR